MYFLGDCRVAVFDVLEIEVLSWGGGGGGGVCGVVGGGLGGGGVSDVR